ncbi:MAG: hypothetical protein JKY95_12075 [Planctomycetaceae bacterium]|nr:hypothetical protein [Planctomycetaceae bacterium]
MRFFRRQLPLLLICTIFISGAWQLEQANAQPRKRNSRSARAALKRTKLAFAENLQALIADLEKGDSTSKLEELIDSDSARVIAIPQQIAKSDAERKRLLRVLKKFEQAEFFMSSRGDAASLVVKIEKEETKVLRSPVKANQPQEIEVNGYGKDLNIVLQKGIDDLDNTRFQDFIRNIYPEAEVARLIDQKQEEHIVSRFKTYPILKQELVRELKLLQQLKPEPVELAGRTVVSFELPKNNRWKTKLVTVNASLRNIPEEPARSVRFELVNGNWRFFDGGKKLTEEMKRQQSGLPVGGGIALEWKRTKSGWRISAIPFF